MYMFYTRTRNGVILYSVYTHARQLNSPSPVRNFRLYAPATTTKGAVAVNQLT